MTPFPFSFLCYDRSSYLIMKTRTTYWWDFLLKNRIHSEKNRLVASSESPSAVKRPQPRSGRDEIEDKLPPYVLLTILDSTTTRRSHHHKCHQEKNWESLQDLLRNLMGRVNCRKSHPADYPTSFNFWSQHFPFFGIIQKHREKICQ